MSDIKGLIEIFFSISLFINALLFIPQAIKIKQKKDSKEVSLLTFLGFNVIQFFTILHAFLFKDYLLLIGYLISFITCGYVIFLIVRYR